MLQLSNPEKTVEGIVQFLKEVFQRNNVKKGIVAVSGGIDSALSLTLLTKALNPENVIAVMLPYHQQSTLLSEQIIAFNQIPQSNVYTVDIGEAVDTICKTAGIESTTSAHTGSDNQLRRGNIQARTRMIYLYDLAKQHSALVCGTENKSEKYLGYFTRFGDEASDIEPLQHLYKTQVRQVAHFLQLPSEILEQAPSAGLWANQTDEKEFGFTYEQADQVLGQIIDKSMDPGSVDLEGIHPELVQKIIAWHDRNQFKRHVPYVMSESSHEPTNDI